MVVKQSASRNGIGESTGWFRSVWSRFRRYFSKSVPVVSPGAPKSGFSVRSQNGFCVLCFPNGEAAIHPECLGEAGIHSTSRGVVELNPETAEKLALSGLRSVRRRMEKTTFARDSWGQAPIRNLVKNRHLQQLKKEEVGLRRSLSAARALIQGGERDGEAAQDR